MKSTTARSLVPPLARIKESLMNKIQIQLGELKLDFEVIGRTTHGGGGPYEDWLQINAKVDICSFSGSSSFDVMPYELTTLSEDLRKLYSQFPNRGTVNFKPIEGLIEMEFRIGTRGQLEGTFAMRDDFMKTVELIGSFETDQNALLTIAEDVQRLVKEVIPAAG